MPREEHKTFIAFFKEIKDACNKGTRVQPKRGRPFSTNTIKAYQTVINQLRAFEPTRRRKLEFDDVNVEFHSDLYLKRHEVFGSSCMEYDKSSRQDVQQIVGYIKGG